MFEIRVNGAVAGTAKNFSAAWVKLVEDAGQHVTLTPDKFGCYRGFDASGTRYEVRPKVTRSFIPYGI